MSSLLEKLEKNRTPILLAEVGAYLHDLGKATNKFIIEGKIKKHNLCSFFTKDKDLTNALNKIKVDICGEHATFKEFIEKHHPEQESGKQKICDVPQVIRLLYAGWKGYDGIDSGLDKGATKKQDKGSVFIATAFGYEPKGNKIENPDKLTKELHNVVKDALNAYTTNNDISELRKTVINDTKIYYLKCLGETRRPANDVTLWDHSYSVATLFKCAVAKNILDCSNASFDPLDFSWKILSINFDVLGILGKSVKIGDILGYIKKIRDVFDKVKEIVEEEYPVGNEIYRDSSGIYFLIPDIETKELKELILNRLIEIEPELMPEITIKKMANLQSYNYKFDCKNQQQIPSNIRSQRRDLEKDRKEILMNVFPETRETALQEISYPTSSNRFFSEKFADNWSNKEVCPICRLRPMKENSDRCKHCLDRRVSRAKNWIKDNPKQTIWLDEVSDHNDRVALLVGCFILDNWLDGSFIKTMAIAIKNNLPSPKNPSPARIRRCWGTTQEFIKSTVFAETLSNFDSGKESHRLELRKKRIQFKLNPNPKIPKGSTCDIDLKGIRLSPVCIDANSSTFVSTINLQILEKWGNTVEEITSNIQDKEVKLKCEEANRWQEGFTISDAKPAEEKFQDYLPYVKIYDFSDQFMVIVPAYDALDIAKKIVEEYETQFSKVRDRLPFHVGVIAFHRKTPLYVAMDAAKRLIDEFKTKTKSIDARIDSICDATDDRLGNYVKKLSLHAPCYSSVPLTWWISYSTGDPKQPDEWHPYFRFNGGNPNRGSYSFDYDGNGHYVVHVKELSRDNHIKIEPSYLKLAYLENAADRFRVGDDLRPLDDIKRLDNLWNDIKNILKSKNLGLSQLYVYWQEVMMRYEDYNGDVVWEDFVRSALTNVLKVLPNKDEKLFDNLFQATKDDLLNLCLYWNLKVMKTKP